MSRIEEIRERVEKATKGPWHAIPHPEYPGGKWAVDTDPKAPWGNFGHICHAVRPDAQLIAHAREDIPYLLDLLEAKEAAE